MYSVFNGKCQHSISNWKWWGIIEVVHLKSEIRKNNWYLTNINSLDTLGFHQSRVTIFAIEKPHMSVYNFNIISLLK